MTTLLRNNYLEPLSASMILSILDRHRNYLQSLQFRLNNTIMTRDHIPTTPPTSYYLPNLTPY